MKGFFAALASNEAVLSVVDFLNVWGLIFIGLGLLLGIFSRVAAIGGAVLLGFYYLSHPPLIGVQYALPSEGSYLFVNKNLIELFALGVISAFPTSTYIGLDRLIARYRNKPVVEERTEAARSGMRKEKVVV
jgi:thiosulfate dehydrogenase [quinone] large subunit